MKTRGVIQTVDLLSREVGVEVSGTVLVFDVPVDCTIVLNGQPVKLRLLLSRDRVEVDYAQDPELPVARCIRVLGSPHVPGEQLAGGVPGPGRE